MFIQNTEANLVQMQQFLKIQEFSGTKNIQKTFTVLHNLHGARKNITSQGIANI